jgi:hypothetical protein
MKIINYKIIFLLIFFFGVFGLTKNSFASGNTYYVCDTVSACNANGGSGWSGTPSDSNNGTSKSTAAKTIKGGIGKMVGGDTLIIGNGTYSGLNNNLCGSSGYEYNVPSGSTGAYTTIKAENDFGVTIDGGGQYTQFYQNGTSYIIFQGFILAHGGSNVYLSNCNHIKILKCIAYDTSSGNVCNFNSANGSYILFEDCAAFGTGRYKFLIGGSTPGSTYTILRRCIGRYDFHDINVPTDPHAVFSFYGNYSSNGFCQNCMAIDSLSMNNGTRAFYAPNGSVNQTFESSIVLNHQGDYGNFFESAATNPHVINSIIWDLNGGVASQSYTSPTGEQIFNSTLGIGSDGVIAQGTTVKNSILTGFTGTGITSAANSYCNLYDNGANYSGTSAGTGNITTNPFTAGLLYLPRIENGSTLKTAGESGGQIGAQIVYQLGVSGTLYGETGWDTVTSALLWPWPNESIIKTQMAAYNDNDVTGARGFATGTSIDGSSQTLTKYIWEYLGNQIPSDIYGTSSDTTPPAAPSGLNVS